MRYQIVCTTRKEDNSIDKLGYIQESGDKDKANAVVSKTDINNAIRQGHTFFFTNEDGQKVEVLAVEDKYVRTSPDGTKRNNLLHLRFCRVK